MRIIVKCFATLNRFQPTEAGSYPLADGATAAELIRRLGVPPGEVAILFVNGVHAEPDRALADGDRVGLFPAVGGG